MPVSEKLDDYPLLKKYADVARKNIRLKIVYDELVFSALSKGLEFFQDHGRPMTWEEKKEWFDERTKRL